MTVADAPAKELEQRIRHDQTNDQTDESGIFQADDGERAPAEDEQNL